MIFNPGTIDKRVDIYRNTTTTGVFDAVKCKLLYHRIAASIQPARGRAYRESNMTAEKANVTITIRYRKDINTACVVSYQSHVYRVTDVIDPDMQHESLELICIETTRGTTPPKGSWEP